MNLRLFKNQTDWSDNKEKVLWIINELDVKIARSFTHLFLSKKGPFCYDSHGIYIEPNIFCYPDGKGSNFLGIMF